ncbi:hypothetical protein NQ317_004549 [Molorchus minor]|uniref:Uncharacterized protein n=1 Tax=Molorchus minor TaxID=1323400 RepID=A0ABQ9JIJ9_9CUCU|nr:hypothetical protein NQ317_004549 [Molorchus minor]
MNSAKTEHVVARCTRNIGTPCIKRSPGSQKKKEITSLPAPGSKQIPASLSIRTNRDSKTRCSQINFCTFPLKINFNQTPQVGIGLDPGAGRLARAKKNECKGKPFSFPGDFSRCCGLGHLHHGRTQKSYSVLSKSNNRAPDSTDSGSHDPTVQTNASLTHKNSTESFAGSQTGGKRPKLYPSTKDRRWQEKDTTKPKPPNGVELQSMSPLPSPTLLTNPAYISVQMKDATPTTITRFLQFFHCIAKRTLDDSKRLSSYHSTPVREPNILELDKTARYDVGRFHRCDDLHKPYISNSSLRDIETGAIEDELTSYMKEIRRRELCS